MRGIRGAITVSENTAAAIGEATKRLMGEIASRNRIGPEDVAAVIFTCTPDLTAMFPAKAAREMGWEDVPYLDTTEMQVDGALEMCIRVLVLANVDLNPRDVKHVYLEGASILRPDLK